MRTRVKMETNEGKNEAPTEDFLIEKFVDHKINTSQRHRYAEAGKPLYSVSWYSYKTDDDTWEPTLHRPRGKIWSYYGNKKLTIPDIIDQADDGWPRQMLWTSCCLDYKTNHQLLSSFPVTVPWKSTFAIWPKLYSVTLRGVRSITISSRYIAQANLYGGSKDYSAWD